MSAQQIRVFVTQAYLSKSWATKVSKMSDEQIFAIYIRIKSRGRS